MQQDISFVVNHAFYIVPASKAWQQTPGADLMEHTRKDAKYPLHPWRYHFYIIRLASQGF